MLISFGCGLPLEGSVTCGEALFFNLHRGLTALPAAGGRRPPFLKANLVAHHNAQGLRTTLRQSCQGWKGGLGMEAAGLICQGCMSFVYASVCSSLLPQSLNTGLLHPFTLHMAQDSHEPRVCMACHE